MNGSQLSGGDHQHHQEQECGLVSKEIAKLLGNHHAMPVPQEQTTSHASCGYFKGRSRRTKTPMLWAKQEKTCKLCRSLFFQNNEAISMLPYTQMPFGERRGRAESPWEIVELIMKDILNLSLTLSPKRWKQKGLNFSKVTNKSFFLPPERARARGNQEQKTKVLCWHSWAVLDNFGPITCVYL